MACSYLVERLSMLRCDSVHIRLPFLPPRHTRSVNVHIHRGGLKVIETVQPEGAADPEERELELKWDITVATDKSSWQWHGDEFLTIRIALDLPPATLLYRPESFDPPVTTAIPFQGIQHIYCRNCGTQLTSRVMKDVWSLPSTGWLELSDVWACDHSTVREMKLTEITAREGVVYVGSTYLMIHPKDIQISSIASRSWERALEASASEARTKRHIQTPTDHESPKLRNVQSTNQSTFATDTPHSNAFVPSPSEKRLSFAELAQDKSSPHSITLLSFSSQRPFAPSHHHGHSHSHDHDHFEPSDPLPPRPPPREWSTIRCSECSSHLGTALLNLKRKHPEDSDDEEAVPLDECRLNVYSVSAPTPQATVACKAGQDVFESYSLESTFARLLQDLSRINTCFQFLLVPRGHPAPLLKVTGTSLDMLHRFLCAGAYFECQELHFHRLCPLQCHHVNARCLGTERASD
eukprot:c15106_g1_i2.p1 GENE.c15106_g1_i2~~c15106_g1_i2.p1  ORF type:complete len:465 (+),score=62.60 c15106_g1_i2:36-1430(+)